jgi:hypothetical protein
MLAAARWNTAKSCAQSGAWCMSSLNSDVGRVLNSLDAPAMTYRSFAAVPLVPPGEGGGDPAGGFPLLRAALPEGLDRPAAPAGPAAPVSSAAPMLAPPVPVAVPPPPFPMPDFIASVPVRAAPASPAPVAPPSPAPVAPLPPPPVTRPEAPSGVARPVSPPWAAAPVSPLWAAPGPPPPPPAPPPQPAPPQPPQPALGAALTPLDRVFRVLRGGSASPTQAGPPERGLQDLFRRL